MTDLYPPLRILFPTREYVIIFVGRMEIMQIPEDMDVEAVGLIVTMSGPAIQHPEFRADILYAAQIIGGDEIPPGKLN